MGAGACPLGRLSPRVPVPVGICPLGRLSPWAPVPCGWLSSGRLSPQAFVPMGTCPSGTCLSRHGGARVQTLPSRWGLLSRDPGLRPQVPRCCSSWDAIYSRRTHTCLGPRWEAATPTPGRQGRWAMGSDGSLPRRDGVPHSVGTCRAASSHFRGADNRATRIRAHKRVDYRQQRGRPKPENQLWQKCRKEGSMHEQRQGHRENPDRAASRDM